MATILDKTVGLPPAAAKSVDAATARATLAALAASGLRRSDLVAAYGARLLGAQGASRLTPNELSQLFLGACDVGEGESARAALGELQRRFPGSARVGRLEAMLLEAEGRFNEAEGRYRELVQADPANRDTRRRLVAVQRAQGRLVEAVEEMAEYLDVFGTDAEAWQELASMYILVQSFSRASFCYEELILTTPQNYVYHLRYAECQYTLGGTGEMETARHYFALSLNLKAEGNLRALYGLLLTHNALKNDKGSRKGATASDAVIAWAQGKLRKAYQDAPAAYLTYVAPLLELK